MRSAFALFLSAAALAIPAAAAAAECETAPADPACVETRVRRAALELSRGQVAPPDRFEVLSYRFGGADPVQGARVEVEPVEVDGPNASGVVRLRFRVRVDGRPAGEARASVRGIVRGPALVARQTLSRGEPIDPGSVEVADAELTRLTALPLRDPREAAGLAPQRTLGAGRVLTRDLVGAAPSVRRGQIVELHVLRGALRVTARGQARLDGAPGERIPVRNTASGAELIGEVLPDGSLLVVRGPLDGGAR